MLYLHFIKKLEMNLLKADLLWMEQEKSYQNVEIHSIEKNGIIAIIELECK